MTKYHFVGIKGTGMSALAQVLYDLNQEVQGSDIEKQFFTQKALEDKSIKIMPFNKDNIEEDQTVIAGSAFSDDHEEIVKAREMGVPTHRYVAFLSDFMQKFTSVAVTGTHGKTSTTGLLAHVFNAFSPASFLIGDGTGSGKKDGEYFIFESCEYKRHFLSYEPDYCLVTNIEFDHSDYYRDLDDVVDAFQEMALKVKKAIIACGDDAKLQSLQSNVPIIYYGFGEENDFQARNVTRTDQGAAFDVFVRNDFYGHFVIPGFGDHNILNALGVIAFCHYQNVPLELVQEQLTSFEGVKRRFTEKKVGQQVLIDDYAHHPTEIKVTIEAAKRKYPEKKIISIFQPHTFTRTMTFLDGFASSLLESDVVYLCDIFGSARENNGALTINDLQSKIPGSQLLSEEKLFELSRYSDAVLLFMGAGDIQKYQTAYEESLLK